MEYLLWIEKYRPKKFNQILGQNKIINLIENMIENGSFPHLILSGNSGTGKTSTVQAIINKLYGKNNTFMVMKLDASDDRGISAVREEIKGFAEKLSFLNKGIKVIILDEADSMTFDAQFALRRIIEKYSDTTRFCLICNYENKIISPIKSRCLNLRFLPIKKEYILEKLIYVCEKENINYEDGTLEVISELSKGDLRKSINLLQSISMSTKNINPTICYNTLGYLDTNIINKIINLLLSKKYDLNFKYKKIDKYIIRNGISLSLFLSQLTPVLLEKIIDLEDDKIATYLSELSNLEHMVSISTFGKLYIISLIAIFN